MTLFDTKTFLSIANKQDGEKKAIKWIEKNYSHLKMEELKDSEDKTPIHIAAENNYVEIMEKLCTREANLEARDKNKNTPLHLAIFNGSLKAMKFLLDKNVGINKINEEGATPLHIAVSKKNLIEVKQLVIEGAQRSITIKDKNGDTPLHIATSTNQKETLKPLLNFLISTDLDIQNNEGYTLLDLAVLKQNIEMIKLLLNKGANVNCKNEGEDTPLHIAVKQEDKGEDKGVEIVKLLLEKGADVDSKNSFRNTPLHEAVSEGSIEIVQLLLDNGAGVKHENLLKKTPLHKAIWSGLIEIVRLLLDKGARVNRKDKDGNTPLHEAVSEGSIEIVRLLLDNRAGVNRKDKDRNTPLHLAVRKGSIGIVQLLLDKGAPVNRKDKDGNTPLHEAVREGSIGIVQLLLDKGARVNRKDQDGNTPLHEAVSEGSIGIVQLLLDNGADIKVMNKEGITPSQLSIIHSQINLLLCDPKNSNTSTFKEQGKNQKVMLHNAILSGDLEAVQSLMDKGVDVNFRCLGLTPLRLAIKHRNIEIIKLLLTKADVKIDYPLYDAISINSAEIVQLLLDKGAGVNRMNQYGMTPLDLAVGEGYLKIVQLLLDHKAYIKSGKWGDIPLILAVDKGYLEIAELLLDRGSNVNGRGWGGTPLHLAVGEGYPKIVQLLLRKGAGVNRKDQDGNTPLDLAFKQDNVEIVELLLDEIKKSTSGVNYKVLYERGIIHGAVKILQSFEELLSDDLDITERENLLYKVIGDNNIKVLEYFLHKSERNVNYFKNQHHNTPLHVATELGNFEAVALLLKHGGVGNYIDAFNLNKETPLHIAAHIGNVKILKLLLQYGANPNACLNQSDTPLDLALKSSSKIAVLPLCSFGANLGVTHLKNIMSNLDKIFVNGNDEDNLLGGLSILLNALDLLPTEEKYTNSILNLSNQLLPLLTSFVPEILKQELIGSEIIKIKEYKIRLEYAYKLFKSTEKIEGHEKLSDACSFILKEEKAIDGLKKKIDEQDSKISKLLFKGSSFKAPSSFRSIDENMLSIIISHLSIKDMSTFASIQKIPVEDAQVIGDVENSGSID